MSRPSLFFTLLLESQEVSCLFSELRILAIGKELHLMQPTINLVPFTSLIQGQYQPPNVERP